MQTNATAGRRTGEQPARDIFRDRTVSGEEIRLFGLLCSLDRGPRGCFANRNTIGRMLGRSLSTVNKQLASLRQLGYITVSRKGQQVGEAGVIRVVTEARLGSGFASLVYSPAANPNLQPEGKSGPDRGAVCSETVNRDLPSDGEPGPDRGTTYRETVNCDLPRDGEPGPDPGDNLPSGGELGPDRGTTCSETVNRDLPPDGESCTNKVDGLCLKETTTTTDSYQEGTYPVRDDEAPEAAVVVSEEVKNTLSVSSREDAESDPNPSPADNAVQSVVVSGKVKSNSSVSRRPASGATPEPPSADNAVEAVVSQATGNNAPVSLLQAPDPSVSPNTNPLQMVAEVLTGVGVDAPTARDLAGSFPAWKCRAMAAYAKDRGVKNPGGFIRQGLKEGWAIPGRYRRSGTPEKRTERRSEGPIAAPATPRPSVPGSARPGPETGQEASPTHPDFDPFSHPEPEGMKVKNAYSAVWKKAIAEMRDMKNLDAWIAPLYMSDIVTRCYISRAQDGNVTLIAPNKYVFMSIQVHLPQVLEGIKSAGMPANHITVKRGDAGQ